ncbi:hypothetical protein VIGAN_04040600 [Vigna angularis var. angularis]|uniref:Uncharacterized protein n=1 Tax=Vigna angularis var. angularis TaxID=157739 RepID=A0A0S3RRW4_PHAAN|nr:hypothetical protein VIGAN_04040600 [Vigna angularis var. angularis]
MSTLSHLDSTLFFNLSKSAPVSTNVPRTSSSNLGGKGRSFKHLLSLFSPGIFLVASSAISSDTLNPNSLGLLMTVLSKKGSNSGAKDGDDSE